MDNDQRPAAPGYASAGDPTKPKQAKRRFSKLTAEEVAGLPGANAKAPKEAESDLKYWVYFAVPVTALIGSAAEAEQVHDFACQLDEQAKAKDVGEVVTVAFANGSAEVVLKLITSGELATHGAPAKNAFSQLDGLLGSASVLTQGVAGKRATWKAKVNGTTIADGRY